MNIDGASGDVSDSQIQVTNLIQIQIAKQIKMP